MAESAVWHATFGLLQAMGLALAPLLTCNKTHTLSEPEKKKGLQEQAAVPPASLISMMGLLCHQQLGLCCSNGQLQRSMT